MHLRVRTFVTGLRYSLFFVPSVGVIVAVGLAIAGLALDRRIDGGAELPLGLASTVESARSLLSTVAGATITFAGVAFSVSLLVIQQASNQYSPRIVHTLFRDPFNKRVMGLVVGTFTYCLVVLRSVRSSIESGDEAVVPHLSVSLATLLGIATILAVVAFINHSAHSMDISTILERARSETLGQLRQDWSEAAPGSPLAATPTTGGIPAWEVRFERSGWIQQLDDQAMLACLPAGVVAVVHTHPGRYAVTGTLLCSTSSKPDDPEAAADAVRAAVSIGDTRTLLQDPSFGVRELVDVALRALSPSVNDPTTAQDAIFHTAAVLSELLRRDAPAPVREGPEGRRLVLSEQPTHDDLVHLAFDEVRQAAAPMPTVCVYLLESLALLDDALAAAGLAGRREPLIAQADLVLAGCESANLLPADIDSVRRAHAKRFGAEAAGAGS